MGSLSRLSLYRHTDGRSGREFRVCGRYVDLLCKETLSASKWGLVAIEIKRSEAPKGTLTQLCEYLALLASQFPSRQVRGMVISSSEEAIDRRILGEVALRYPIDWFRYKVAIEKVASSGQSE